MTQANKAEKLTEFKIRREIAGHVKYSSWKQSQVV